MIFTANNNSKMNLSRKLLTEMHLASRNMIIALRNLKPQIKKVSFSLLLKLGDMLCPLESSFEITVSELQCYHRDIDMISIKSAESSPLVFVIQYAF